MNWSKVSDYCIRSDGWLVCKVIVGGVAMYEVWRGRERVGDWPTAQGAKDYITGRESAVVGTRRDG